MDDDRILAKANAEGMIVLTSDKDFGELVFRKELHCCGVVLLRFHTSTRQEFVDLFESFWHEIASSARDHFVTVSNRSLRIRPLP
jgi:predicted nuclease of predicted toxin-antitoxin system